jgi:hypothetical protein
MQRESDDGPGRSNDANAWKAPVLSVMAVQMKQSGGITHAAGLRITSWPDGRGTDCVAHVASPPRVPASSRALLTRSQPRPSGHHPSSRTVTMFRTSYGSGSGALCVIG